jgi:uncharacterized protein (TIGR02453 family)
MPQTFPGFPRDALTFLRQLERNNSREWFQPRKEIYDQKVRAPMLRLIELLNGDLRRFAADYASEPKKAIYRIHRDTRFSKDKTPYKTHVAAMFAATGMPKNTAAGFYFHVAPQGVVVAGGMYMPGPLELAAVRAAIADDPAAFRKLAGSRSTRAVGELHGTRLARVPKGFAADHPGAEFLRMKQFYFDVTLPVAVATSPKLQREIAKRFEVMAPLVHWINAAARNAAREEDAQIDAVPKRPAPMF